MRGLSIVTFSSILSLLLLCIQVTAVPLADSDNGAPGQALLTGDPLKDFVSSVTKGKEHHHSHDSDVQDDDDAIYIQDEDDDGDDDDTVEPLTRPSWFTSTLRARRMLALSKTGIVSTIFPDHLPSTSSAPPAVAGLSIPLPEYIADCDEDLPDGNGGEGNPTLLALRVATTFRNTAVGSNISLSLDWWDHLDKTKPVYPGFPLSAAGLPRVTLFGYVVPFPTPLSNETKSTLESCYLSSHPDAAVWLPEKQGSPHSSFWARMVVTQAYWIGGFGDTQQIGWINMTEWAGIRRKGSLPGVGDGRGWEDVRLPGEEDADDYGDE
ncbi:hypothetical protein VTN00DRAFT_8957 [Thermoascus crustaceus]|uniref:uncharacterized protein n=1 Tax=Thermoascus crustaceus TaxID=5088 RepID=UPI0037437632